MQQSTDRFSNCIYEVFHSSPWNVTIDLTFTLTLEIHLCIVMLSIKLDEVAARIGADP